MIPTLLRIDPARLDSDGFMLRDFPYLRDTGLQSEAARIYADFKPARNATNHNARGLRWGIYARDTFSWLDRATYSLSEQLNLEEGGRVREMDLIPESFLRRSEIEELFRDVFQALCLEPDSFQRAYEIQLSAIRYAPQHGRTASSPPPHPHQDGTDGGVIVLAKCERAR